MLDLVCKRVSETSDIDINHSKGLSIRLLNNQLALIEVIGAALNRARVYREAITQIEIESIKYVYVVKI